MSAMPSELEPQTEVFDGQATLIVEIIMTQHWDMKSCDCWVCVEGRKAGCRPRWRYLDAKREHARIPIPVLGGKKP